MATYRQVIEGLQILAKHDPKGLDSHGVEAEHDVIYAGDGPVDLSAEDRKKLEELRWHYDDEVDSWARFT